jgi:hypothetical protein
MKTLLKLMQKHKTEIPSDKLMLFEHIVQNCFLLSKSSVVYCLEPICLRQFFYGGII